MDTRKIIAAALNLALTIGVALIPLSAEPAVPTTLNFQGQLTSAAGAPVSGTVSMTFSLFDVATGGTALWSEAQSVTVSNGLYSVTLGQTTPLTPAMFGVPLYLGVKVGTDAEMTPRIAMTSSATALRAQLADSISCTGCITAAQLASGVIPAAGAVPAGTLIMTKSSTPPAGYSYTGGDLRSSDSVWLAKAPIPLPLFGSSNGLTFTALNGKVYAIGNYNTGTASAPVYTNFNQAYDPATDTWAAKAPSPVIATLNTAFYSLAATASNGKLYVIGATNTGTVSVPVYASFNQVYDPVNDTWVAKAPLPSGLVAAKVAALNGKVYAMGMSNTGTASAPVYAVFIEEYDSISDTWVAKAPLLSGMSSPPSFASMTLTGLSGKLYVMQALSTSTTLAPNINKEYDPVTDAWLAKTPLPFQATLGSVATLNGKLYAVGSYTGTNARWAREYDPVSDTWMDKTAPLHNGLLTATDIKIYDFSVIPSLEEFDPALDVPLYLHVKQ